MWVGGRPTNRIWLNSPTALLVQPNSNRTNSLSHTNTNTHTLLRIEKKATVFRTHKFMLFIFPFRSEARLQATLFALHFSIPLFYSFYSFMQIPVALNEQCEFHILSRWKFQCWDGAQVVFVPCPYTCFRRIVRIRMWRTFECTLHNVYIHKYTITEIVSGPLYHN